MTAQARALVVRLGVEQQVQRLELRSREGGIRDRTRFRRDGFLDPETGPARVDDVVRRLLEEPREHVVR